MTNINFKAVLDTTGLDQALNNVSNKVKSVSEKMGQAAKIAGAAFVAVGTGAAVAIKRQIDYADALGETAQKLGVSTQKLSEYRYAAELSGVTTETLESGLSRLNRQIIENTDKFTQLGIQVKNADGSFRDSGEVMTDLAEVFQEMPDGAEKSALAMELFGRSGAELIPLLNQGAEGISALAAEANAMGLVITPDQAEAAGQFNDALDKISKTVQGAMLIAFAALAPYLESIATFALDAVSAFNSLDENTKLMIITVGSLAAALGVATTAFKLLFAGMGPVGWIILGIGVAISGLIVYWDEIKAVMSTLAEFITSTFTAAWEGLKTTLSGWAESFKAGVGAAVDYVTGLFNDLIGTVQGVIDKAVALKNAFLEALGLGEEVSVLDSVEPKVYESGRSPSQIIGETLGTDISTGFENGLDLETPMRNKTKDAVAGSKDELKSNSPSKVFEQIGSDVVAGFNIGLANTPIVFQDKLKDFVEKSKTDAEQMADIFTNAFSGMEDALVGFIKTGKLDFSKMIDSMIEDLARFAIKSAMYGSNGTGGLFGGMMGGGGKGAASKGAGLMGGGLKSRNGNAFGSSGQLNFARGGVFNQKFALPMGDGRLAIGAEAGPEAIMPLQRGSDGKLGVVATAMGTGGGQTTVNNFNTTINPGPNTSPQDARKFAEEFNRAVEVKVLETMAKQRNTGIGGRKGF